MKAIYIIGDIRVCQVPNAYYKFQSIDKDGNVVAKFRHALDAKIDAEKRNQKGGQQK